VRGGGGKIEKRADRGRAGTMWGKRVEVMDFC